MQRCLWYLYSYIWTFIPRDEITCFHLDNNLWYFLYIRIGALVWIDYIDIIYEKNIVSKNVLDIICSVIIILILLTWLFCI